MVINNKRELNYNSFNRKRLKYFSYEEEYYCNDGSQNENRDVDKVRILFCKCVYNNYDLKFRLKKNCFENCGKENRVSV